MSLIGGEGEGNVEGSANVDGGAASAGVVDAAAGAAGGNAVAGDGGAGGAATEVVWPTNWKSGLPEDIRADPSLDPILDIPNLAKSYVHAQKNMGADKLTIPGKHATEQDWRAVYSKLGMPADLKDYNVNVPEESFVDKALAEKFREKAFGLNLLPKQAEGLAAWWNETSQTMTAASQQQNVDQLEKNQAQLKADLGEAYDARVSLAKRAVQEVAGEDWPTVQKYLETSGIGNEPTMVKLFANVGKALFAEDSIKGENAGQLGTTPAEANKRAMDIIGGAMDSPYHDSKHPNHQAAVTEVQELLEKSG